MGSPNAPARAAVTSFLEQWNSVRSARFGALSLTGLSLASLLLPPKTTKPTRPQQSVQRFQHYELVKGEDGKPLELGRGAMGVTDKAFDIDLRCTVTLKGVWGYSSAVLDLVILILYTHFRQSMPVAGFKVSLSYRYVSQRCYEEITS